MRVERVENRILGAINFVDAVSGLRIVEPLAVTGTNLELRRNNSSYYAMVTAVGLEAHNPEFLAPPNQPAVGALSFALQVEDVRRQYLPRRFTIRLPRNPNPSSADAVTVPINVLMYPTPTAPLGARWAVVRASVFAQGTDRRLGGALIRVVRVTGGTLLARGLSDSRGEALVAVEGIPVTTWDDGEGPVISNEIEVTLETIFDPNAEGFPDPDDLETRRGALPSSSTNVRLASGRILSAVLSVVLP